MTQLLLATTFPNSVFMLTISTAPFQRILDTIHVVLSYHILDELARLSNENLSKTRLAQEKNLVTVDPSSLLRLGFETKTIVSAETCN